MGNINYIMTNSWIFLSNCNSKKYTLQQKKKKKKKMLQFRE